MSYSTYVVRQVFKDTSKGRIIGPEGEAIPFDANRNNIAIVDFPNDDGDPTHTITYFMNGADLSDAVIASQAFFVIQTLNSQEAGLATITVGTPAQPKPPNPAQADLVKKQAAYAVAARDSMAKFRNDPAEIQALADLKAAEDALSQASQASVKLS